MPLTIKVQEKEIWDDALEEFVKIPETILHLEHSLAAISKWESETKKPFIHQEGLSGKAFDRYLRCMAVEEDVPEIVFKGLSFSDITRIRAYMNDSKTATWFKKDPSKAKPTRKIITSEVIYGQMVDLGIPFECDKWHLSRLLTLICVCAEKQTPPKKMAQRDILREYASLNAARRAKLGTKG